MHSNEKDLRSLVVFDIVDPIELDAFSKRWDSLIRGTGYSGTIKIKNTDNREKWLKGSFAALYNAAHEVNRIVFTGHDISEERRLETENKTQSENLKRQEKLLREAEKELASKVRETKLELQNQFRDTERIKTLDDHILEESPEAIVTTGHDNRIRFLNKAAEMLWGMERGEIIGEDIGVLFPEKLTETNEIIGSFTRPGDHKVLGKKSNTFVIDKHGNEKPVVMLLSKVRIDGENYYTAFFQAL
jgi:PAS domain S-box-containing protein